MDKNKVITVLGILVGLLTITLIIKDGCKPPPPPPLDGEKKVGDDIVVRPIPPEPPNKPPKTSHPPITGNDVDRLPDTRIITNSFIVSGKGYYAKWGRGIKAGFVQKGDFAAEAKVIERKKFENGRFMVVEDRTFLTARETLEIGEADYFLALDTLPIDEVSSVIDTAGNVVNAIGGVLVKTALPPLEVAGAITKTAGGVAGLVASGLRHFKVTMNGKSLKELGIDLSAAAKEKVESQLNDLSRKPKEIEMIIRNVEGRTYRFTYIQEASGKPLNVTAERVVEGKTSPVETEEEVWILCRCNSFIDAEFLKNGGEQIPQPGDRWNVDARSVARIVGVDGYCNGRLTCCRTDSGSAQGGLWEFSINPAELDVNDDSGRSLGKISLSGGKSHVYVEGRTLKDITMHGSGKLDRVNKNSILYLPFNEKFIGDCTFGGTMKTIVEKK